MKTLTTYEASELFRKRTTGESDSETAFLFDSLFLSLYDEMGEGIDKNIGGWEGVEDWI